MPLSSILRPRELAQRTHAIQLYSIPQDIRTYTTIMPKEIETLPYAHKRLLTEPEDRKAFFDALLASKPGPSRSISEFRVKATLLDTAGNRVCEIYASTLTSYGMIDGDEFITFGTRDFVDYCLEAIAARP